MGIKFVGFDEAASGQRAQGDEGAEVRELLRPAHCRRRQHEHLPVPYCGGELPNFKQRVVEAVEEGDEDVIEKFSKRIVKVTKQHNDDCKRLLRLMGVPVVEAPCEAEAECAALCINDKVYAVASEDMDSPSFGAPRFLRHLVDPSSKKIPVIEFEVTKVLEEFELTLTCVSFVDVTIVMVLKVLGVKQL